MSKHNITLDEPAQFDTGNKIYHFRYLETKIGFKLNVTQEMGGTNFSSFFLFFSIFKRIFTFT